MTDEELMQRGEALARQCMGAGVLENQLAVVLAHLKRHQDPRATRRLLSELNRSPFAVRTKSSRRQYEALEKHVGAALGRTSDWNEAANVVGWAKRLAPIFKKRTH